MRRYLPAIILSVVFLLLITTAYRPYRASRSIWIEMAQIEKAEIDALPAAIATTLPPLLSVQEFWPMTRADLKAAFAANGISVRVQESPRDPSRKHQFTFTAYNVDRHAAAAQANAAAIIATRELQDLRKWRIVICGWPDINPPPIHVEQDLFQRLLLSANR